jgi:NADH-quinone oxidoreductase subunit K
MTSELTNYLVVGAVLFGLGALGFLTRRNLIVVILSAELMLQGVSLNLVAFSFEHATYEGEAFTAIVLTVAACEAALALALISALYRRKRSLDISAWHDLGEPDVVLPPEESDVSPPRLPLRPHPRLTRSGLVPEPVVQETSPHV